MNSAPERNDGQISGHHNPFFTDLCPEGIEHAINPTTGVLEVSISPRAQSWIMDPNHPYWTDTLPPLLAAYVQTEYQAIEQHYALTGNPAFATTFSTHIQETWLSYFTSMRDKEAYAAVGGLHVDKVVVWLHDTLIQNLSLRSFLAAEVGKKLIYFNPGYTPGKSPTNLRRKLEDSSRNQDWEDQMQDDFETMGKNIIIRTDIVSGIRGWKLDQLTALYMSDDDDLLQHAYASIEFQFLVSRGQNNI